VTFRRTAVGLLALGILSAAAAVLWHFAKTLTLDAITQALRRTPVTSMYASAVATIVSFAGLAYYDGFATRLMVPGKVANGWAWFVGATSHAVSNTVGIPVLTGSALRYRLYRQAGVRAADIARVVVLIGFCVGLGSVAVLLVALTLAPATPASMRAASTVALLAMVTMLCQVRWITRTLARRGVSLPTMTPYALLRPLGVGAVEACAAIYAFYILLPGDLRPDFATLASIVIGAMLLGILSHSPGGLGVFEATILASFPGNRHADVLAALFLFRLIYNITPFTIAVLCLAVQQGRLIGGSSVGRRIERH
jgi:uncharacterized membrane protein YbhN (UPF0104 family)